ncbi:MAG: glutamine synthetase [Chloroflexi bacterium]|nr:glutamine synthetase [Chloroflexota bacterium]MCI0877349.1 glutamine synthetase [Chloroflexota bacterium]MCI0893831.1 glutamine synthetase [Chloroflexota bacterium]
MLEERAAEREFVLRSAQENDVKFVRLWFTDILGSLKGFAITVDDLQDAIEQGVGFDGASIEGFARINESDMRAFPDPTTFVILPWRPRQNAVARMFCDIRTPKGEPFEGDPRYALKRNLERLAKVGYTYYVGPELEFFYFKDSESPQPLDKGGYFDQLSAPPAADLRRDTVLNLAEMGIPVKYSHHEAAHSQHEIDLQYTDALTMADTVITAKLVIKELAQLRSAYASFMPKPLSGMNGSGMHIHQSLFRGNDNAFFDLDDEHHLSIVGKRFIAGLLRHAPEITLVTNQWVNSYKRLVPGYEAPVFISWAHINRSDLVRVPAYKPGYESSVRIEYRAPDPACNPYLAFSAMLAAGLKGIEEEYPVPPPVEGNVFAMSSDERQARGIKTLPSSLGEAITLAEDSALLRDVLGEHIFDSFIRNKKIEWEEYRATVTDYEISRYLPML